MWMSPVGNQGCRQIKHLACYHRMAIQGADDWYVLPYFLAHNLEEMAVKIRKCGAARSPVQG